MQRSAFSRARFLQSGLITVHGASDVLQWTNIASLACVQSPQRSPQRSGQRSSQAMSIGLSFHRWSGCALRSVERLTVPPLPASSRPSEQDHCTPAR
jgi:hypothetical protein